MSRSQSATTHLLLVLAVAACGKSSTDKRSQGVSGSTPNAVDPIAVASLVPPELAPNVEFVTREIVVEGFRRRTVYTLAAPKSWRATSTSFGDLAPAAELGLGLFTKMQVSSNCNGECKPKDWAKESEVQFAELAKGTVKKDVKAATSRLMVGETTIADNRLVTVLFAWWSPGADKYYYCQADLDEPVHAAVAAFEKACQAIKFVTTDLD